MSTKLETTPLLESGTNNGLPKSEPRSEANDVKYTHHPHYTRDDVIGFLYSVLSGFCLAVSAVFVKLLEGKKIIV